MKNIFKELGIQIPEILLPKNGVKLSKWAVVACDQYTSQPEYWKEVETLVDGVPSTLELVFPEVYLEEAGKEERIKKINSIMKQYLKDGTLTKCRPGFVYVDRKTSHAESRKGLVVAVDLEKYDYTKGSQTLIRATEGTVVDRLPPRIKIRENASIELPHIMLLIDDPDRTVIEPLAAKADKLQKIYDFELMKDGGHIKGYMVDDDKTLDEIAAAFEKLASKSVFVNKYRVKEDKGLLLFAAGDGNHSLATAKGHWENLKKALSKEELENHPARYALVEVVNVHDEGLVFEPIHRVVFGVDPENLVKELVDILKGCGSSVKNFNSKSEMDAELKKARNIKGTHTLPFVTSKGYGAVTVTNPQCNLEVGTLQAFLDEYQNTHTEMKIDYIHGAEVVDSLGSQVGNMGFYLPPMDKNDLFKTVILDGVLPRKTFSMGEAEEKRFYLECRSIVKEQP